MGRYYTLSEVNRLVPRVRDCFTNVMQLRAQLKPIYRRLELAGHAPERSDFEVAVSGVSMDVLRDRASFKGLVETLNEALETIAETGAVVKDLDAGLVDWLASRHGAEIWLCWRYGEGEVAFWHDMESGFAGRRPVAELAGTEAAPELV